MAQTKAHYAWIGPNNGYAEIFWDAQSPAKYDWIGIYSSQTKGQDDFITWQWATNGSSYVTDCYIKSGLSVRYFTWLSSDTGKLSNEGDQVELDLNEVDHEAGKRKMTPGLVLSKLSGSYSEIMRSGDLDLKGEVEDQNESKLEPGCWVEPYSNGYAKIYWTAATNQGDSDWVALYSSIYKSNDDYISGTWQWAKGNSSYETSQAYIAGIHARYIKQGSPYVALRRSKPIYAGYLDLSNIYISTDGIDLCVIAKEGVKDDSGSLSQILRIMSDQLHKAWKCEPSVFSLSPYKNLLFKNLSMQEVRVIGAELSITEYYDVLMIYYKTYLMAIQIADDGERNAKRHAFWQISLAQRFGVDFAIKLGNAHEEGRPGTAEDNRVDEINNKNALEYNAGHPGIDPKEAADTMWEEGLIVGYKKDVAPEHTKDEF